MSKKSVSSRRFSALALIALLTTSLLHPLGAVYLSDSDLSQGVLGFLRSLESTIEKKTAWFYRHFGQNVDPAKIDKVRLCDYGSPSNSKYCSPAFSEKKPVQNPNLPDGVTVNNNPLSKKDRTTFTSIPMKCLNDPDAAGCRDLRTLTGDTISNTTNSADSSLPGIGGSSSEISKLADGEDDSVTEETPAESPNDYVSQAPTPPISSVASEHPTNYMCYGNHDEFKQAAANGDEMTNVRGKWCESSMPSVSLEPSGAPIIFQTGGQEGEEGTRRPTSAPSDAPSEDPSPIPSREPSSSPSSKPSFFAVRLSRF